MTLRDYNGDGKSDLLWYNQTTQDVYLWELNGVSLVGSGYVTTLSGGSGFFSSGATSIVAEGDFNGDTRTDLLIAQSYFPNADLYAWSMNGPTVSSSTYVTTISNLNTRIVGTGDLNGDHTTDILVETSSGSSYSLSDWQMSGGHAVGGGYIGDVPTSWSLKATADFNGDGNTDLLWQAGNGDILLWDMNGRGVIGGGYVATMPTTDFTLIASGDFNGDGKADLLWQERSTGNLYLWDMNDAQIKASGYVATMNPTLWHLADSGDYNGDGKTDLLWQDTSGNLYQWQMNDTHVTGGGYIGTMGSNWVLENV